MLDKKLTEEEIHDLSLIVANKIEDNSDIESTAQKVLEDYKKSVKYYKKLNKEYLDKNPPRITFLK